MCSFDEKKMFTFLRGFASGANLQETKIALAYSRQAHAGQKRKSGQSYIIHPLTMACDAIGLGIRDDDMIAAILLHDVLEDCGVALDSLPVNDRIRHSVELLTFRLLEGENKDDALSRYYAMILSDRAATLCKIIDRCHNVSTMAGVFSREKLTAYIAETRKYVLPLLRQAKQTYPQDSDVFFILKYHLLSVVASIEATMQAYENQ